MIELWHIGEKLISKILDASDVRALISEKIGIDITMDGVQSMPEVHLKKSGDFGFDGMHKIDVAVLNQHNKSCIAIEAKLGNDRLAKCEFEKRFLEPCEISDHLPRRVNGSMIAILERNFNTELKKAWNDIPIIVNDNFKLEKKWILIVRKRVLDKWGESNGPSLSDRCIKLSFESLISCYGGHDKFNVLVKEIIDCNYYEKWGLK